MYNNYGSPRQTYSPPPQQTYGPTQQFQPLPYETQGLHCHKDHRESACDSQLPQSHNNYDVAQQPYGSHQQQLYKNYDASQPPPPHGQFPPGQPYNTPLQPPNYQAYSEKPPHEFSSDDRNAQNEYPDEKCQHVSLLNQHNLPVATLSNTAPPPQQPITFHFSGTAREKTILHTNITDPWGRVVLSVSSPSKKQSVVSDGEGRIMASFDWDHSSPIMIYGEQKMKTKEWLPYQKKPTKRFIMHHKGQSYNWTDVPNGDTILSHESAPGRVLAVSPELGGHVQVQVFPEALSQGLLEPILLSIFLLACKNPFGDVGGGTSLMTSIAVSAFTFL